MKSGIFIGRFQPVHQGHVHALGIAASQVEKLYILVGSANQCRSIKNPWTFQERVQMLRNKLRTANISNYEILPLNDYRYSDSQWMSDVRATVDHYDMGVPTLFGHMKEGNNYLTWFPDWPFKSIESQYNVNATAVRQRMFDLKDPDMPETVQADYAFYEKEKVTFANYPFPETLNFNCSDAILECQGHVLLIQRKFAPGAGAWALPGGFRNRNESFLDCAIRELQEETNVRVPEKVLRGSIVKTELFDDPTRSFGIPRNTMAVYMRINPNPDFSLPRANGADDAALCKWVPLTDALNTIQMYDDHKDILSKVTGVNPMPAFSKL
jgi:bifunctional NMN adenylyltransferase/nudix hydrolase